MGKWSPTTAPVTISYGLRFLYNPSLIEISHSVDLSSQVLPTAVRDKDDGDYLTPTNSSMSINLLFDRSYEVWDYSYQRYQVSPGEDVGDLAAQGVYKDIGAFYNMVGIAGSSYLTQDLKKDSSGGTINKKTDIGSGVMQYTKCLFVFGASVKSLWFYGMPTGATIQLHPLQQAHGADPRDAVPRCANHAAERDRQLLDSDQPARAVLGHQHEQGQRRVGTGET